MHHKQPALQSGPLQVSGGRLKLRSDSQVANFVQAKLLLPGIHRQLAAAQLRGCGSDAGLQAKGRRKPHQRLSGRKACCRQAHCSKTAPTRFRLVRARHCASHRAHWLAEPHASQIRHAAQVGSAARCACCARCAHLADLGQAGQQLNQLVSPVFHLRGLCCGNSLQGQDSGECVEEYTQHIACKGA